MAVAFIDPVPLLEDAKAFLPELEAIGIETGNIIIVGLILATQEQALLQKIRKAIRTKVKVTDKDNQQVVKVADAIRCVSKGVRDPKTLLTMAKSIIQAVRGGDALTIINTVENEIAECIRAHALQQKNVKQKRRRPVRHRIPRSGR